MMKIKEFFKDTFRFISFLIKLCRRFLVGEASISNPIKKKYSGTVVILANGPSLKDVLPHININDSFKDIDFLCMNHFALDKTFLKIKPKHYVFADIVYFGIGFYGNRDNNSVLFDEVFKIYSIFQDDVDWELNIYVPMVYRNIFIDVSKITNKNIHIIGINTLIYSGYNSFRNFFYAKGLAMTRNMNVALMAIYVCINSGYANVLLYGVDHTFLDLYVNENNDLFIKDKHFYEDTQLVPLLKGSDAVKYRIGDYLSQIAGLFKNHELLEKYANSQSVNIINCTHCSLIDSYKRIPQDMASYNIDEILNRFAK